MRPRTSLRRIVFRSHRIPTSLRTFTRNSASFYQTRPQLPYLSVPTTTRQRVRYLTTERKRWLRYEFLLSVKYTAYVWAMAACVLAAAFAVNEERLEREHPTPHEWLFLTRMALRGALRERDRTDVARTDWVRVIQMLQDVLQRLEHPDFDGEDVRNAAPDHPAGCKDIGAKSENWRRGYFEALLACAKASEHVEGWVRDKTRDIVFPPDVVIGPSNPRPKPIPPGAKSAPREENCEPCFPSPDELYLRLLGTEGLTNRQRMDAALSYASWLEYKQLLGPASIMYEDAIDLALRDADPSSPAPVNKETWVLNETAQTPSANLLASLTAMSTFKARNGDVAGAAPIMISLLKARRSLPKTAPQPPRGSSRPENQNAVLQAVDAIKSLVQPPEYPPAPDDGSRPPIRDAEELCEEAALHLHVGEIMYTGSAAGRDEGVAWTREAVDLAEEQLHRLGRATTDAAAKASCRACLASALENWTRMAHLRRREEEEKAQAPAPASTSYGWLWSDGRKEDQVGRWEAEEKVAIERMARAKELLEDVEPPKSGLSSILRA